MTVTETRQIRIADATCTPPRARAWRVRASSQYCVQSGDYNTGAKAWTTLEEYYTDDNTLTGQTKPNAVGDPDYRGPENDEVACPIPIRGCTDPSALNYNPNAVIDDGSCAYGCPDPGPQPQTPCAGGWTLGFLPGSDCPSWICPDGGGL